MLDVIIADNQDITAAGIRYLLQSVKDVGQIEKAESKKELIRFLASRTGRVAVVLDYTLFDFEGADDLLILSERFPMVHCLLFSEDLSTDFLSRLLFSSHSFSVALKSSAKEEITAALYHAARGERFICNRVSNQLLNVRQDTSREKPDRLLTVTEKEILREIALGKTTKEIAAGRNLSFHTVITHRKNIFRKLEVNNLHEATRYAMRAGIVDLAEYYI